MHQFITGAPVYIWPLLAALIVIGLISTRDRTASLIPMLLLPLLGVARLPNLLRMPDQFLTWAVWGLCYGLGVWFGHRVQERYLVSRDGMRATLKGEWITFAMIMVIFWSSYVLGVMNAIAPDMLKSAPQSIIFPALAGLGAGFFLGRVVRVLRA